MCYCNYYNVLYFEDQKLQLVQLLLIATSTSLVLKACIAFIRLLGTVHNSGFNLWKHIRLNTLVLAETFSN